MSPGPAVDRDIVAAGDGGLAAERTELAWGRSTLALFACGVGTAKGVPSVTGNTGHTTVGVVILVLGGVVWLLGVPQARARARAGRAGVRHRATTQQLAPVALGTAAVGVAALLIALLHV